MLVHLSVGQAGVPPQAVFGQINQAKSDELFHELSAVVAACSELLRSGWPLVFLKEPLFEVAEELLLLHRVVHKHTHVSSPSHSTDVNDVPALLQVVHIDGHDALVAGSRVLEEIVASVGISVDNTERFISDLDVGMGRSSKDSIARGLVRLELLKLRWVSLRVLNRPGTESTPVVAICSDGTLLSEPRVGGIRWKVLWRNASSEEGHGDSE